MTKRQDLMIHAPRDSRAWLLRHLAVANWSCQLATASGLVTTGRALHAFKKERPRPFAGLSSTKHCNMSRNQVASCTYMNGRALYVYDHVATLGSSSRGLDSATLTSYSSVYGAAEDESPDPVHFGSQDAICLSYLVAA
jgi:hypothetical protein